MADEEDKMGRLLTGCLTANLACILVCGALLWLYPRNSGFTITTSQRTHYFGGGPLLGALVLCLSDVAIAVFLAWTWLRRMNAT